MCPADPARRTGLSGCSSRNPRRTRVAVKSNGTTSVRFPLCPAQPARRSYCRMGIARFQRTPPARLPAALHVRALCVLLTHVWSKISGGLIYSESSREEVLGGRPRRRLSWACSSLERSLGWSSRRDGSASWSRPRWGGQRPLIKRARSVCL